MMGRVDVPSRRTFLAGTGAFTLASAPDFATALAIKSKSAPQRDVFRRVPVDQVKLRGHLGQVIDACVQKRVLAQDWETLVQAFRTRTETKCWQTEFWGKWFTSAVAAYRYSKAPKLKVVLERSVGALLAAQSADGYLGNYAPDKHLEGWDIWGRKYTLLGLLAWHDLTGDAAALRAARSMADHLMSEVGPGGKDIVRTGNFRGMPSSSILEPMVLLHRATGDARYLDFAQYIVRRWSSTEGPRLVEKALAGIPVAARFPRAAKWWTWENGLKAYEMMSCYEGLLELHRLTGRTDHLRAVAATVNDIRASEITIAGSGSSLECWYGGRARQTQPARHMTETCVTVTWMKLCENLLRFTGRPEYVDDIERAAYNTLLAAMHPDGSAFAKYSPLEGFREIGPPQCEMGLHCCTANGPRGLMLLPQMAYLVAAEGPVINLYCDSEATVTLDDGLQVKLIQTTTYPVGDEVTIEVHPQRPARFVLQLRIPGWSKENRLAVGDAQATPPIPGTYARIDRHWNAGDRIHLKLDLRGRIEKAPDGSGSHVAVVRGPLVLARDDRFAAGDDIDEVATPVADKDGIVALESIPAPANVWMAFRAPFVDGTHDRKGQLVLCDYPSAGNRWDPRNRFRVWIPGQYDPSKL